METQVASDSLVGMASLDAKGDMCFGELCVSFSSSTCVVAMTLLMALLMMRRRRASEKAESLSGVRKTVLIADYDGCWDILVPELKAKFSGERDEEIYVASGYLTSAVDKITANSTPLLFMGSARQSYSVDHVNMLHNKNGFAFDNFEKLAKRNWQGRRWELNKTLLADGEGGSVGSAWGNKEKDLPLSLHMKNNTDQQAYKQDIVENVFKELAQMDFEGDVFFFDDREDYLAYVREHACIPSGINFYTVHYDWYLYAIEGEDADLVKVDVQGNVVPL